jgi:hypothetical protein
MRIILVGAKNTQDRDLTYLRLYRDPRPMAPRADRLRDSARSRPLPRRCEDDSRDPEKARTRSALSPAARRHSRRGGTAPVQSSAQAMVPIASRTSRTTALGRRSARRGRAADRYPRAAGGDRHDPRITRLIEQSSANVVPSIACESRADRPAPPVAKRGACGAESTSPATCSQTACSSGTDFTPRARGFAPGRAFGVSALPCDRPIPPPRATAAGRR